MTFEEVSASVSALAKQIEEHGFRPDFIVGLARGGWVPARLLSSRLKVKKLLSIGLAYEDAARTQLVPYSMPDPFPHDNRVLVVEDCLESGASMDAARSLLLHAGNDVKTASIFITPGTRYMPDFYVQRLPSAPGFPWE